VLRPHEALVIVRGRVNEVTDDLFDGPRLGFVSRGRDGGVDRPELDCPQVNDPRQFIG
jgi:hypothetical protein